MAKRLTEIQKEEIIQLFVSGINVDKLSEQFNCSKLTITRILKKNLGDEIYKELSKKRKSKIKLADKINQQFNNLLENKKIEEPYKESQFIEIVPLDLDIENSTQKDFTSVDISNFTFPKSVYMVVDKKVELQIKYLKDYPKWQFLSENELKRKTIEIYFDLKLAKSFCNNDQKVIKVPNTNVFKKVAPILISRGITRIVSSDQIIAL